MNKAFFKYYKIYMIEQELKKYESAIQKFKGKTTKTQQGRHIKSVSEDRMLYNTNVNINQMNMSNVRENYYTNKNSEIMPDLKNCRQKCEIMVTYNKNKGKRGRSKDSSLRPKNI